MSLTLTTFGLIILVGISIAASVRYGKEIYIKYFTPKFGLIDIKKEEMQQEKFCRTILGRVAEISGISPISLASHIKPVGMVAARSLYATICVEKKVKHRIVAKVVNKNISTIHFYIHDYKPCATFVHLKSEYIKKYGEYETRRK